MDDGVPISAQTPTEYTIGIIDAGSNNPWYIDPVTTQHLKGGALQTVGWTRVEGSNTGIVKVPVSGSSIVEGDIGLDISHSDGDAGTLLYVQSDFLHIRPDSSAAANNFDSTSGTLSCNGHTASQTAAASSGENVWANIFTLGTIETNTELYVYQNNLPLAQWWPTGHMDILVTVRDFGSLIDLGLLFIYARQYTKQYDHFSVSVANGGRTPVPLATAADINNSSGYKTFTGSSGNGTFNPGNYIYVGANWASATKKAVLTQVAGTTANPELTYYLIGNLTDFAASDAVKEFNPATMTDGDASCTAGSPSASGPEAAPASGLTIGFGGIDRDLDNGNGMRPYAVELDLQGSIEVEDLYQRLKYITRRGYTGDIDTETGQTVIGQAYTGIGDYQIPFDSGSTADPFTEGETITATGSFSGILTAKHITGSGEGFMILRQTRGTTPADGVTLTGAGSGHTALVDEDGGADPVVAISPVKVSPFGTFAGGKFFGARGVWLANVPAADATNYELVDCMGVRQVPPQSIAITVTGVVQNTQCYVADLNQFEYLNTPATSQVSGNRYQASTTLVYASDIPVIVRAREMGYLPYESTAIIGAGGLFVTAVWQVDPNWKLVVSGVDITFNENSPSADAIVRASGNFETDGWLAVMGQVTVEGSTGNDGTYEIGSISGGTLTLATAEELTQEGPASGVTLTFSRREL